MCRADNRNFCSNILQPVNDTVITCPDTLKVFIGLELLAAYRAGMVWQSQNLTVDSAKQRLVQRIKFLLSRLLDVERKLSHEASCASGGWRDIRLTFPYEMALSSLTATRGSG